MKLYLECYSCVLRQMLSTAKLSGLQEEQQKLVLHKTMDILQENKEQMSPQHIIVRTYEDIKTRFFDADKSFDPYKKLKFESNKTVLEYYDYLEAFVKNSSTPLEVAIRKAAAGNIIDFGAKDHANINIEHEIQNIPLLKFSIYDIDAFKACLAQAKTVLYVGDNAGEIVFDKILIKQIRRQMPNVHIVFATRDKAIINDATLEDAYQVGLDKEAEVISSGCKYPGLMLSETSAVFQDIYQKADLIIAKGQGNYEGMSDIDDSRLFHILRIKCERVAQDIKASKGDLILWNKIHSEEKILAK